MKLRQAVVIGGGLGGLATALRLCVRGWQVVLCEQNTQLGGKMNLFTQDGLRFDTGPSLITMPWIFQELFADAGEDIDSYIAFVPVQPLGKYVFSDGSQFVYSSSLPKWLETLQAVSPSDADSFFRYMHLGARLYQLSAATFLRRPIGAPPDKTTLHAMFHMPIRHAWGNYHQTVKSFFRDNRLQQLFDRYPTFVGSSPYEVPATLTLIPYIEYALGGFHVQGGLYKIVDALASILKSRGVVIRTGTAVASIELSGRCVRGVTTSSGEFIPAHVVVQNGDVCTTARLLGRRDTPRNIKDQSLSGFVLLLTVRRSQLPFVHHNVFFSADYHQEFEALCREYRFPDDPTVYISAPGRTDPTLLTDNYEPLFVMANAPAREDIWNERNITTARQNILRRLRQSGLTDLEKLVVREHIITPQDIAQRDGAPGGAIYGQNSHGWRKAFFRPPNKDRTIRGLYYVGGTTHPGGGTPIVLLSARIAVELIERYETS